MREMPPNRPSVRTRPISLEHQAPMSRQPAPPPLKPQAHRRDRPPRFRRRCAPPFATPKPTLLASPGPAKARTARPVRTGAAPRSSLCDAFSALITPRASPVRVFAIPMREKRLPRAPTGEYAPMPVNKGPGVRARRLGHASSVEGQPHSEVCQSRAALSPGVCFSAGA